MAEAALREISTPEATAATIGAKTGEAVQAISELRDRLYRQWETLNDRISYKTSGGLPGLKEELRDDADYVITRARYYHESRPLSAVGMIAAAAFVLGAAIGLGRH